MIDRPSTAGRPALRLITPAELEPVVPSVAFCSHCGTRPTTPVNHAVPGSRVCGDCGLGLILEAAEDVAPHAGDAFLVLDRVLSVCAVSRGAEHLLATSEPDAVNRHVTELLMPADAEEQLREAPSYAAGNEFDWGDRSRELEIHNYYRVPPYWGAY